MFMTRSWPLVHTIPVSSALPAAAEPLYSLIARVGERIGRTGMIVPCVYFFESDPLIRVSKTQAPLGIVTADAFGGPLHGAGVAEQD